jgi:hypothetical protein
MILSLFALNENIQVNGSYQNQNQMFVYGSYLNHGYLLSYDVDTLEIQFEVTYDIEDDNTFIYLADVLDGYIVVAEKSIGYDLVQYNKEGLLLKSISFNESIKGYHNHHGFLILEMEDDIFYMNQSFNLIDEIDHYFYINQRDDLQYQGELYVNGIKSDRIVMNDFGAYDVLIVDGDYQFNYQLMNEPQVFYYNGVDAFDMMNGMIFYEPIQLFTQANQMILNDDFYYGEFITSPGHYQLSVIDHDVPYQTIDFVIYPKVEGLIEGDVETQSFYVFGEAYLNDSQVSGYIFVDHVGEYELKVYFDHDIFQTYHFRIQETHESISIIVYVFMILFVFIGVIILFKK